MTYSPTNIVTPNTIKQKATSLLNDTAALTYYNEAAGLYFHIPFYRQTTFLGGDSGVGKTYLINKLKYLLKRQYTQADKAGIISSTTVERLKIVTSEEALKDSYEATDILLADRVDSYSAEGLSVINGHISKGGTQILISRTDEGLKLKYPGICLDLIYFEIPLPSTPHPRVLQCFETEVAI